MKQLTALSGLILTLVSCWGATAAFADVNDALESNVFNVPSTLQQTMLTGKVTGVNFATHSFWIATGNGPAVAVDASNAAFRITNEDANIYRLLGSPLVQVAGTVNGVLLDADSVTILSGPTARLQESFYTDQAQPPFPVGSLAPLHVEEPAGVTAGTHTYSGQSTYANRQHQLHH